MTVRLKRFILRALGNLGYILVKKAEYEKLLARTVTPQAAAGSSADSCTARRDDPGGSPEGLPNADFHRFYELLPCRSTLPLFRLLAVYSAVRYLTDARIHGDIVDCGSGSSETLAAIATALVTLGDTSRTLVLLDVTGDATHRAESELALWGDHDDLLRPPPRSDRNAGGMHRLPADLTATGYPPDLLRVSHGLPDFTRSIAFLGLTTESYPANRASIRELFPRLATGGVIAVDGGGSTAAPHRDAFAEFLRDQKIHLLLPYVTSTYRIGVRSQSLADPP